MSFSPRCPQEDVTPASRTQIFPSPHRKKSTKRFCFSGNKTPPEDSCYSWSLPIAFRLTRSQVNHQADQDNEMFENNTQKPGGNHPLLQPLSCHRGGAGASESQVSVTKTYWDRLVEESTKEWQYSHTWEYVSNETE